MVSSSSSPPLLFRVLRIVVVREEIGGMILVGKLPVVLLVAKVSARKAQRSKGASREKVFGCRIRILFVSALLCNGTCRSNTGLMDASKTERSTSQNGRNFFVTWQSYSTVEKRNSIVFEGRITAIRRSKRCQNMWFSRKVSSTSLVRGAHRLSRSLMLLLYFMP